MALKKVIKGLLAVTLWLPVIGGCTPPAGQRADVTRCIADPDVKRCSYVNRYESSKVYERPDTTSRELGLVGWGADVIQIDWPRTKDAPVGWLPLWTGDSDNRRPSGWIELKNLARMGEFKRVIGCWPVAFINDGVGDWGIDAKMRPDGTALLDSGSPNEKRSFVSFIPNLVLIGGLVYGYDVKTHRLRNPHTSREPDKITYFHSEQLKGCEAGLKLEK